MTTTNTQTTSAKTPSHVAYQVRDREGGKGFWTRIGAASPWLRNIARNWFLTRVWRSTSWPRNSIAARQARTSSGGTCACGT